jgi:hypothetical protein
MAAPDQFLVSPPDQFLMSLDRRRLALAYPSASAAGI